MSKDPSLNVPINCPNLQLQGVLELEFDLFHQVKVVSIWTSFRVINTGAGLGAAKPKGWSLGPPRYSK